MNPRQVNYLFLKLFVVTVVPATVISDTTSFVEGQVTTESIEACPNGHSTFELVPIIYGANSLFSKLPSELSEPERDLMSKISNREVISGPDVVFGESSPKIQIACELCGFYLEDLNPGLVSPRWHKADSKITTFQHPFPKVFYAVDQLLFQNSDLECVKKEFGQHAVGNQVVSYYATGYFEGDPEALEAQVEAFFVSSKFLQILTEFDVNKDSWNVKINPVLSMHGITVFVYVTEAEER